MAHSTPLFATVGLFTASCHRFSTVHVQLIQFCNIIQSFPIGDQRRLERSPASMAGRTSTLLHAGQSGRIAESVEHQLLPDHGQGHHPLRRHQRRQRPLLQLTSGRKKRKRRKKLVKTSQSRWGHHRQISTGSTPRNIHLTPCLGGWVAVPSRSPVPSAPPPPSADSSTNEPNRKLLSLHLRVNSMWLQRTNPTPFKTPVLRHLLLGHQSTAKCYSSSYH